MKYYIYLNLLLILKNFYLRILWKIKARGAGIKKRVAFLSVNLVWIKGTLKWEIFL